MFIRGIGSAIDADRDCEGRYSIYAKTLGHLFSSQELLLLQKYKRLDVLVTLVELQHFR